MCLCAFVCALASHFHVISNSNSDRNEINADFSCGFGYCHKYLISSFEKVKTHGTWISKIPDFK